MTEQEERFKDIVYVLDESKKYGVGIQLWQTQKGYWKIKVAQVYVSQYGPRFSMRELNDNQKAKGAVNPNVSFDPGLVPALCEALLKAAEQAKEKATPKADPPF